MDGAIQDVEKLINFDNIPESARNAITQDLESQFNKFRLTRIQIQYFPADEDDADFIDDILQQDAEDYEIRYEIEVDGENRRELGSFEMLYNESGSLIEKRRILRPSLDNIWQPVYPTMQKPFLLTSVILIPLFAKAPSDTEWIWSLELSYSWSTSDRVSYNTKLVIFTDLNEIEY
jgi:hypothetical protein